MIYCLLVYYRMRLRVQNCCLMPISQIYGSTNYQIIQASLLVIFSQIKPINYDKLIIIRFMDEDLKKGLLSRKGSAFDKLYEDCVVRIQRIKQKNDVIQKQIGTQIEDSIKTEVNKQRVFLEKEINELKSLMIQIENKHRDPQSKNKIKQLKSEAQKQIQRNKIILKDLINKSFASRSIGRNHEQQDSDNYMIGGRVNYNHLDEDKHNETVSHKDSMITDQDIEIDYELERKIMLEKNEIINEVEQSTLRINQIMNDIGVMVDEQGEQLDTITEELMKTDKNLVDTNNNLEEASMLQRKSRKKYAFLVFLLILIIVVVAGVLFFTIT